MKVIHVKRNDFFPYKKIVKTKNYSLCSLKQVLFSALESLLLRESVLDNVKNTSLMVLSKADYASKDRKVIKVIQHRSYLFDLIQKDVIGIQEFCSRIHISSATLYKMRDEKFISHESWDKIIKGYLGVVSYSEYAKFRNPYDFACYQAFHERENFKRKKRSHK